MNAIHETDGHSTDPFSQGGRTSRQPPVDDATHGSGLCFRCPYCHGLIESLSAESGTSISCPHCSGTFDLAADNVESNGAAVGRRIAHFELLQRLGQGSFGSVWKARDTLLDRTVALKIPRSGRQAPKEVESFLREARAAARISHPNIISVHEVGLEADTVYIACDYYEGESLDRRLARERLSVDEVARLTLTIAEALQAAHSAGIIHRDLKPPNILMDREGQPHIADFGLAKQRVADVSVTRDGHILGTVAYMPPEQARGRGSDADERSDLYSLGSILYELLTGKTPFNGNLHMMISQILWNEPIPPRSLNGLVPRDLETICLKCLRKSPGRRYQSATELADDLRCYLDGKPIRARRIGRMERTWLWCRRRPALAIASAAALLMLAVTVTVLAMAHAETSASLALAEENWYFNAISVAQRKWLENDQRVAESTLRECPKELRDFEWRYLYHLVNTPEWHIVHAGGSVVYRPDGKEFATSGGTERALKIWNAETGKCEHRLVGHSGYLTCLDYSRDGKRIISAGGSDGTVRLWDADDGARIRVLGHHTGKVIQCAFTPDESQAVSYGMDRTVRVWNTASGESVHVLRLPPGRIRQIAFSPADCYVAVATGRGVTSRITVLDYQSDVEIFHIPTFDTTTAGLAFSPDGQRLAVAEYRRGVRIWQLSPFKLFGTILGPVSEKPRVTFDAAGERIAAESWDGSIQIWRVADGRTEMTLRGHSLPLYQIAFSPDGRQLAAGVGNSKVIVWDITSEQGSVAYVGGTSAVNDLAVSPDGKYLAAGFYDGSVRVWDRTNPRAKFSWPGDGKIVWSIDFSPDGRQIAVAGEDMRVRIYDMMSGTPVRILDDLQRSLRTVVFSPDGTRIAAAGLGHRVVVWNAITGKLDREFASTGPAIRSLVFHPDGHMLVGGGRNGRVTAWNVVTGAEEWRITDTAIRVWDVAFSPNGEYLAVSRDNGTVHLYDANGDRRQVFGNLSGPLFVALAFSPNGRRLVTATTHVAVSLWHIPTGRGVLSLSRRPGIAGAVAFSPDGEAILTATMDGTVLLWPTKSE